ncbi:uncharacterized protein [Atheta coriaria]|uniref:uncharacterized protein n=1 Tax=Dalotia coriaria TaxID=877792 RepID=UPI0031F3E697
MSSSELSILEKLSSDESITKEQYHTYQPRTNNLKKNDEIRILIQQHDQYSKPYESYLYIQGEVVLPEATTQDPTPSATLLKNAFCYLFQEARYEINGVEIDRNQDVGTTTTIKNYLSCKPNNYNNILFGWEKSGELSLYNNTKRTFYAQIPLNKLFGFAEDYRKIIVNARQELILLRSATDKNCYVESANVEINLSKVEWHMPHVELNDSSRIQFLSILKADKPLLVPFRKWELHELPALKNTSNDIWSVKTSTSLERPRYVIVCFQTDKKNNHMQDVTIFDHCNIRIMKVFLNSTSYPYDNMNLDFENNNYITAYNNFLNFLPSYYQTEYKSTTSNLTYADFKNHTFYVFDVTKQNESVKTSTIDLQIEMESTKVFPANTKAFCLILFDSIVEYTPLTGIVRKIV